MRVLASANVGSLSLTLARCWQKPTMIPGMLVYLMIEIMGV